MNRRTRCILAAVAVAFPALLGAPQADAQQPNRPNILFIVGDDMGYADVGFHGCKEIPTPNLDSLAASGVRFTSGYVSGPYCSPTRAGLMTGRYQTRFGHEFNPGPDNGLPLGEKTLADRLKAAGYVTGLVGKWHLGALPEMHPQKRGFDEFYGFLGGAHDYFKREGVLRGNEPVEKLDYTTDAFAREAVDFIERHRDRPWFLYLAFNAVHTPMQATDERLAKFSGVADERRRTYDAMMLAMDEAIGRVRQKLVDAGLEKNTLVAFISDNGGPTMPGTSGNASRNAPLRGSKRTTLEGGVRVPFLVSWPGRVKPGVFNQPAIQLDLHTTALAAAGVEAKLEWKLDGVNLLPYLDGKQAGSPHDALYWRFGEQMAIRHGDYKLVRYDGNVDTGTGLPNQPVTAAKLYNLADDISETKDLAAAMPEKVKELQSKWDSWNATLAAPLWGGGKAATAAARAAVRPPVRRNPELDIYVVDTEGGKAMILESPSGETMLVDAGYPREDDRDTNRIVEVAKAAGIRQFDYVVATHYDMDHSGNVARLDSRIPCKVFVDHGEPLPTLNAESRSNFYDAYVKAIGDRKRLSVKPGDVIPMKGLRITVVTAGGKTISQPLPGGGQPNELTPAEHPTYQERDDNAGSTGLVYEFGKFRMLDLADLLSAIEYDLVCPKNLVGPVDLFMVAHHGFKVSNAKFLVHAVRPRVAIVNNGADKGGDPETLDILKTSPGLEDVWQLHYSNVGGAKNAPADFIANPKVPCEAKLIKVTARRNGAFTVTNMRNGYSKTYRPR